MSNFGLFLFCSDFPNFWHVSYKLKGKHFSVFFSLVFFSFSRYNVHVCKTILEKQEASFVSPTTKEQQRKLLGNIKKRKLVKKFVARMPKNRQL